MEECSDAPPCEQQPGNRAKQGNQQTFDEELANDPPAVCAERQARHDFAPSRDGTRQCQTRDIGARYHDHEGDGAHENPQSFPDIAYHRLFEWNDLCRPASVVFRIQLFKAPRDGLYFGLSCRDGLPVAKSAHGLPVADGPAVHLPAATHGSPKLRRTGKLELRRHNTGDRCRPRGSLNLFSDDRPIAAESVLPKPMTQHDVWRLVQLIPQLESAAKHWLDAHCLEKICGNARCPDLLHSIAKPEG